MCYRQFFFALAMNVIAVSAMAQATITVSSSTTREINDPLKFGFNCPWLAIQGYENSTSGIWDDSPTEMITPDGWIRSDIVTFMKKSVPGAYYRYPGGTTSQYFRWKQTVGAFTSRTNQNYLWNTSIYPTFGFDEFMKFVESVKGSAMIAVNMNACASLDDTAQEAADWVAYANATTGTWATLRANNGHAAPYNIQYWELGNELDASLWSKADYIAACKACITKMQSVDSNIKIIAHAASAPWGDYYDTYGFNWNTWHQEVLAEEGVGDELAGIAFHAYYDGYGVPGLQINYINPIWSDCQSAFPGNPPLVYHTEHAKWPSNLDNHTTWPGTTSIGGAVSSIDFMLSCLQNTGNAMAIYHAFAGTGPWLMFNGVDSATGLYSGSIHCLRPLAHAWKLYGRNLVGKKVLSTTVVTSNLSNYGAIYTGYDVRSVGLQDKDGVGLLVAAINRYTSPLAVTVTLPVMPTEPTSGLFSGRLEYVGGDDEGENGILSRYVNTGSDKKFVFNLPKQSVSTLRLLGGNYVVNPSFEDDYYWSKRLWNNTDGTKTIVESSDADSGAKYVRLAKTGTGTVFAVQGTGANTALTSTGFVATHLTDQFIFTAVCKGNGLDTAGAKLKLQFFGSDSTYAGMYSPGIVTGTTGWKPLSVSFVPADAIAAGKSFSYMELCLQNSSATGSSDFDTAALIHQPNIVLNGSFENFASSSPDSWTKSGTTITKITADSRHGSNCVKLSGGAGQLAQYGWMNSALKSNGLIASRPTDYFRLKAWAKWSALNSSGAHLRIQIFQRPIGGGTATLAALVDSPKVTGAGDWTKQSISFRVQDYLSSGYELSYIDVVLRNNSSTGYVYFDSVGLYPDYDIDINDSPVID